MKTMGLVAAMAAALVFAAPAVAAAADAPVSVMIIGDFHMSNPGHDLHNMHVDDVLLPKPQAELDRITRALLRFKPTVVVAEWDTDTTRERYAKYVAGTLDPSHNEVVQLGFRLAKAANLASVYGIDVDGDFPLTRSMHTRKRTGSRRSWNPRTPISRPRWRRRKSFSPRAAFPRRCAG
jgi:hypothetical protein